MNTLNRVVPIISYEEQKAEYASECGTDGIRFVEKYLDNQLYVSEGAFLLAKAAQLGDFADRESGLKLKVVKEFIYFVKNDLESYHPEGLYHVGSLQEAWDSAVACRLMKAA